MMKQKFLFSNFSLLTSLFLCLLLFLSSCGTANMEIPKQQSEASRNLGEAYYAQGDYTAALNEFLKAAKLYPDDPYLQNDLGLTYMMKGKMDLAVECFKKAVVLNPEYAPARNNLGTAYLAKGEWDAAIAIFKEITEDLLYATPHFPLSNLGLAYYNKKQYETAERYYLESLKIEPDFVVALKGLGKTYIALGKIREAVATLEKAVKNAPNFAAVYFDLGEAYTLAHNYPQAVFMYQKVTELAPDTTLAEDAKKEIMKIR